MFRGSVDLTNHERGKLSGVRVQDRIYQGLDLSGSELYACWLSHRTFRDCDFRDARIELVFADYCHFERCIFTDIHATESVFAGSTFEDCSTVGATVDRCNFNAVRAANCDFSDTSFRSSRFINARLDTVQFQNCDLYEVLFHFSERNQVNFRHSNIEDAHFS